MTHSSEIKKLPDGRILIITKPIDMNKFFNTGDTIHGFCNGVFGRDDYYSKICILSTPKYAVFQYLEGLYEGNATVLNNPDRLNETQVSEWKTKNKGE